MALCSRCGKTLDSGDSQSPVCPACSAGEPNQPPAAPVSSEFDRRGVRLPAKSRVGGIIIPQ